LFIDTKWVFSQSFYVQTSKKPVSFSCMLLQLELLANVFINKNGRKINVFLLNVKNVFFTSMRSIPVAGSTKGHSSGVERQGHSRTVGPPFCNLHRGTLPKLCGLIGRLCCKVSDGTSNLHGIELRSIWCEFLVRAGKNLFFLEHVF